MDRAPARPPGREAGARPFESATPDVKVIRFSDIAGCPRMSLLPQHYYADGSCRCDDEDLECAWCHADISGDGQAEPITMWDEPNGSSGFQCTDYGGCSDRAMGERLRKLGQTLRVRKLRPVEVVRVRGDVL